MSGRVEFAWLTILTLPVFIAGCGPSGPRLVPVEGIVTFDGKAAPAAGFVYFTVVSTAPDTPNQPGSARFDVNGRFEASTTMGKGLLPGTYRVRIDCWKEAPSELSPGTSYVPAGYSPANLVVPADTSDPIRLKLDVPSNTDAAVSQKP